jgi:hypothetical protein
MKSRTFTVIQDTLSAVLIVGTLSGVWLVNEPPQAAETAPWECHTDMECELEERERLNQ